MPTLAEQLENIYPATKPQRQRECQRTKMSSGCGYNNRWIIDLIPTTTLFPPPPCNDRGVTVRMVGDYYQVSICPQRCLPGSISKFARGHLTGAIVLQRTKQILLKEKYMLTELQKARIVKEQTEAFLTDGFGTLDLSGSPSLQPLPNRQIRASR